MTFYRDVLIGNDVRHAHTVVALEHVKDGLTAVHVMSDDYSSRLERAVDDTLTFEAAESWVMSLPEFKEYEDSRSQLLDEVGDILTDEQAILVPDVYKEWRVGVAYKVDDRRRYGEKLYKCIQPHTSQADYTPDVAVSLWVEIAKPGEIPVWRRPTGAHDAYNTGDKVHFETEEDPIYMSTKDANVHSPAEWPEGWELVDEVVA